jgi:hypothetical protein
VWLSVPLCRVGSGLRRDSTRKQMTELEAGGVFENAFHSTSEGVRIGTRYLLNGFLGSVRASCWTYCRQEEVTLQ